MKSSVPQVPPPCLRCLHRNFSDTRTFGGLIDDRYANFAKPRLAIKKESLELVATLQYARTNCSFEEARRGGESPNLRLRARRARSEPLVSNHHILN